MQFLLEFGISFFFFLEFYFRYEFLEFVVSFFCNLIFEIWNLIFGFFKFTFALSQRGALNNELRSYPKNLSE